MPVVTMASFDSEACQPNDSPRHQTAILIHDTTSRGGIITYPPEQNYEDPPRLLNRARTCPDLLNHLKGTTTPTKSLPLSRTTHPTRLFNNQTSASFPVNEEANQEPLSLDEIPSEGHLLIHIEPHGLISLSAIYRALSRLDSHHHNHHIFPRRGLEDHPSGNSSSDVRGGSSTIAEPDNSSYSYCGSSSEEEHSVASSQVLGMGRGLSSSSFLGFMGGAFEQSCHHHHHHLSNQHCRDGEGDGGFAGTLFTSHGPIWLAPEILAPMVMGIDPRAGFEGGRVGCL